jgi:hypothetical protein
LLSSRYLKQHTDCEVLVAQDKGHPLQGETNVPPVLPPEDDIYQGATTGLLPGTMQASGLNGQTVRKMPIYHQGGSAVLPAPGQMPGVVSNVIKAGSVQYAFNVFWPEKKTAGLEPVMELTDLAVPRPLRRKNPLGNPEFPMHGLIARATQEATRISSWMNVCSQTSAV